MKNLSSIKLAGEAEKHPELLVVGKKIPSGIIPVVLNYFINFIIWKPPNTWNVHDTTLHGSHRTNNPTEGWNNRFAHLVGQKHPTIWKLIRKIKNEVAADLAKLALNGVGEPFNKRKKLGLTQTTEKRLKELCTRIPNDEINVEYFLKAIAHNIRKRCND